MPMDLVRSSPEEESLDLIAESLNPKIGDFVIVAVEMKHGTFKNFVGQILSCEN